jgi:mono/diheme cytochrome c family protein
MNPTRKTGLKVACIIISGWLLGASLSASPETQDGGYDGKQLFAYYCAACHQADGSGTEGGPPPLELSPWIKGPEQHPIRIVLGGLHGPITVNDKIYDLEMPGFGAILSDPQIASILSYVRLAFGRQDDIIVSGDIAKYRPESVARGRYWTAPELLVAPQFP